MGFRNHISLSFGSSRVPSLPGSCHFLEVVLCNEAAFEPGVVRGEGL